MSSVATAIVGSAVVGAGVGIYASKKSSDAQKDASERASDGQLEMYYQSREDMMPWHEAGKKSLGKATKAIDAAAGPKDYRNALRESPGYQFRFNEGQKAIERSSAVRGGRAGGRALKELTRYGQNYASGEYDLYRQRESEGEQRNINNLLRVSGFGSDAAGTMSRTGAATGEGVARSELYGGNARASGYINSANSVTGNLRSGVQDYMFYNQMRK